jgi:DNA-binding transcriptional LysR family regulator
LHSAAASGAQVAAEDVLAYGFAVPSLPFFGQRPPEQALDGWRDDLLPRKALFKSSCLKMLEECVLAGEALAYLPDVHVKEFGAMPLKLTGLPFRSSLEVWVVARPSDQLPWLSKILSSLIQAG